MSSHKWAVMVPLIAALGLAGCSGSGAPTDASTESPLSKYLSSVWGSNLSDEEQQAKFQEQQKRAEELVAECMSKEGFEYIPNTSNTTFSTGSYIEWKPDDRDWVSQYGYGMVNSPMSNTPPDQGDSYQDPNSDYVSSLSTSEQAAYYAALYGAPQTETTGSEEASYEYKWEEAGCQGAAQHEVNGESILESDEFATINKAINEFYTAMQSSPEYAALDAKWASCMADAGHSGFTAQSDAQTSISDELNEYYSTQTDYVENDPKLKEVGEREIALALADLDCREKTNYRGEQTKIQFALEERFITDHKAELDAMKAAAERAR